MTAEAEKLPEQYRVREPGDPPASVDAARAEDARLIELHQATKIKLASIRDSGSGARTTGLHHIRRLATRRQVYLRKWIAREASKVVRESELAAAERKAAKEARKLAHQMKVRNDATRKALEKRAKADAHAKRLEEAAAGRTRREERWRRGGRVDTVRMLCELAERMEREGSEYADDVRHIADTAGGPHD